jgi:membrane-bound metal-dependent hydrolase YbcI (DUF457 family)
MFIGHFGVALALKRLSPRASLAELVAATTWADILWTIFLLLGWEHVRISAGDTKWTPLDLYDYPWSHSLLLMVIWGFVLAAVYRTWRDDWAGTLAIGAGVVSHWLLDWTTHRADMPLYPYGPKYGLGLWNSISATMVVEFVVFLTGVALYAWSTKPRDRWGRWGFRIYVVLLLVLFIGDRFSTPPESVSGIAWTGLIATVVLIGWAWWFDRHRNTGEIPLMSDLTSSGRSLEERFE